MPHIKGTDCTELVIKELYKRCADAVQQEADRIEFKGFYYHVEHVQNLLWWIKNRPCMKSKIGCPSIDHGDNDDIFLESNRT